MLLSIPPGFHIWGVNNDKHSQAASTSAPAPPAPNQYNSNYLKSPLKYVSPTPTIANSASVQYWAFNKGADDKGFTTASTQAQPPPAPAAYNSSSLKGNPNNKLITSLLSAYAARCKGIVGGTLGAI